MTRIVYENVVKSSPWLYRSYFLKMGLRVFLCVVVLLAHNVYTSGLSAQVDHRDTADVFPLCVDSPVCAQIPDVCHSPDARLVSLCPDTCGSCPSLAPPPSPPDPAPLTPGHPHAAGWVGSAAMEGGVSAVCEPRVRARAPLVRLEG